MTDVITESFGVPLPLEPSKLEVRMCAKKDRPELGLIERTFDTDGFRRRGGVVPIRTTPEGETQVLLIAWPESDASLHRFILPAGGVDPGEEAHISAAREAVEEAGIRGDIDSYLGVSQSNSSKTRTDYFMLRVLEELEVWEEGEKGRVRHWVSFAFASAHLARKPAQLRALLAAARALRIPYSDLDIPSDLKFNGPFYDAATGTHYSQDAHAPDSSLAACAPVADPDPGPNPDPPVTEPPSAAGTETDSEAPADDALTPK